MDLRDQGWLFHGRGREGKSEPGRVAFQAEGTACAKASFAS